MTIKRNKFVFLLFLVLVFSLLKISLNEDLGTYIEYGVYEDKVDPVIMNCQDTCIGVDLNCQATLILTNAAFDTSACTNMECIKWICEIDLWADGTIDYIAATHFTQHNWTEFEQDEDTWYRDPHYKIHIDATESMDREDQGMDQLSQDQIVTLIVPDTIAVRISNHKVTWKAIDANENESGCQMNIFVADKKKPTPNCVKSKGAFLIDGSVEIWARDFDINSFDNCTAQDDLYFTFNEMRGPLKDTIIRDSNKDYTVNADIPYFFSERGFVGFNGDGVITDVNGNIIPVASTGNINKYNQGDIQKWVPEFNSSSKIFDVFDCATQGPHGLPVKISVWDKINNTDFCEVLLGLVANDFPCNDFGYWISGKVTDEKFDLLEDVKFTFEIDTIDFIRYLIAHDGLFILKNNLPNLSYTIYGSYDKNYMNGISTLDLILIQRHILQLQELPTVYRLIAADVNDDLNITISDVDEIRKMILGITNEFTAPSWRILDNLDPIPYQVPLQFSSLRYIPNLQGHNLGVNFIATKMGDVSGDAKANSNSTNTDSISNYELTLDVDEASYLAGESFTLDVTSSNFENIFGMQFSASIEGLLFDGVIAGSISIDEASFGLPKAETLTFSWAANEATTKSKDDILFTLKFTAQRNIILSQVLDIHSEVTKSESYIGLEMETGTVNLIVNGEQNALAENELYQNVPNPFNDYTEVSYFLTNPGLGYFRMYSIDGKLLMQIVIDSKKGMNLIGISKQYLGSAKGIIYYQIESGDFKDTKKMIILE